MKTRQQIKYMQGNPSRLPWCWVVGLTSQHFATILRLPFTHSMQRIASSSKTISSMDFWHHQKLEIHMCCNGKHLVHLIGKKEENEFIWEPWNFELENRICVLLRITATFCSSHLFEKTPVIHKAFKQNSCWHSISFTRKACLSKKRIITFFHFTSLLDRYVITAARTISKRRVEAGLPRKT